MHLSGCILTLSVGKNKPKEFQMTDPSLTSLPALDLLGMLYSAQANYANAKSDREREIVQKQKDEILAAMQTIVDVLNQQIEQFS